jgi:hypothetical protein
MLKTSKTPENTTQNAPKPQKKEMILPKMILQIFTTTKIAKLREKQAFSPSFSRYFAFFVVQKRVCKIISGKIIFL